MNRLLTIVALTLLYSGSVNILYGQSLDSLLLLVVENNPELKALNSEYKAELQRVDQVSTLPNPTVGVGVPIFQPETRLGPQLMMVSASQMFPWFGTLAAKEDVVISMSKAKFERISALKLELFYQVKTSFYMLNFLRIKKELLNKKIGLYQSIENIALANVESGQSTTADVLRIQLVIRELRQQIDLISNEENSNELVINQITNRDLNNKILTPPEMEANILVDFDTSVYRKKISEHHPLIEKINFQIETSENRQIVNRKMNSPTFGLGVDYNLVGERTDANPVNNGRDILVPKIMVTIPIYRKGYKAKNQEEVFIQEALSFEKESLIDKIIRMLLQYKLEYDNSILHINLHKEQIKTTSQTIDILLTDYSSSGQGFDDLLQLENQLLLHEIGLIKGLLDQNIAIAKIDRLTDF